MPKAAGVAASSLRLTATLVALTASATASRADAISTAPSWRRLTSEHFEMRTDLDPAAGASDPAFEATPAAATGDAERFRRALPLAGARDVRSARTLSNGMALLVVQRPDAHAVWARLGFRGGESYGGSATLARLAAGHRPSGAPTAGDLGMTMASGIDRESSYFESSFQPEQLAAALALMFDDARAPTRAWSTPADARRWMLGGPKDDPAGVAAVLAQRRALYGDHPLGLVVGGDHWEQFSRADGDAWLTSVQRPENGVLVIAGDVEPDEVARIANELSADWKAKTKDDQPIPSPPAPPLRADAMAGPRSVFVARDGSSRIDLRLGCLLPRWTANTRTHVFLFDTLIHQRLRAALGFPVGVYDPMWIRADVWPGGAAELTIELDTTQRGLSATLAALRSAWNRWRASGFTATEVDLARAAVVGQYLAIKDTNPVQLARTAFYQWIEDLPFVAADREPGELFSITPEALNEDVNGMFRVCADNTVLSLVGDEAASRRALQSAWPEVQTSN